MQYSLNPAQRCILKLCLHSHLSPCVNSQRLPGWQVCVQIPAIQAEQFRTTDKFEQLYQGAGSTVGLTDLATVGKLHVVAIVAPYYYQPEWRAARTLVFHVYQQAPRPVGLPISIGRFGPGYLCQGVNAPADAARAAHSPAQSPIALDWQRFASRFFPTPGFEASLCRYHDQLNANL